MSDAQEHYAARSRYPAPRPIVAARHLRTNPSKHPCTLSSETGFLCRSSQPSSPSAQGTCARVIHISVLLIKT
jgi:hypothetical protein